MVTLNPVSITITQALNALEFEINAHQHIAVDPLFAGFYSLNEAALLLQIPSTKARGWLNGWTASGGQPIIQRDFADTIEYFKNQGVSLQTLRKGAEKLRLQ